MPNRDYDQNLSPAARQLNPRQRVFCHRFVLKGNATQAYAEAGFAPDGTKDTIKNGANVLMRNKYVQAYIEEITQERINNLNVTADNVLMEFAYIAFARITDVVGWNEDGIKIKSSEELSDRAKASVAKITETTVRGSKTITVEMHNKVVALKTLMSRYGLDKSIDAYMAEIRSRGYDIVDRREDFTLVPEGEKEETDGSEEDEDEDQESED